MWPSSLPFAPPSLCPNWLPADCRGPLVLWEGPPLLQPPQGVCSNTPASDSVVVVLPEPPELLCGPS